MDVTKITEIVYPTVTVKRGETISTSSEVQVWLDDFLLVRIGYDYRYTSNSHQWALAESIATPYRKPMPENEKATT